MSSMSAHVFEAILVPDKCCEEDNMEEKSDRKENELVHPLQRLIARSSYYLESQERPI